MRNFRLITCVILAKSKKIITTDKLYLLIGGVCLDNVDGVPQEDGEHCQLFDFPKVHYKVRKVTKFHGNSSILSMFNTDLK